MPTYRHSAARLGEQGPDLVPSSSAGWDVRPDVSTALPRVRRLVLAPSQGNPRRASIVHLPGGGDLTLCSWYAHRGDDWLGLEHPSSAWVGLSLVARGIDSAELVDVARLTTTFAEGPLRRLCHPLGVDVWWTQRTPGGDLTIGHVPHATVAPTSEGWLRIDAGVVNVAEFLTQGGLDGIVAAHRATTPDYATNLRTFPPTDALRVWRNMRTAWSVGHATHMDTLHPF